MSGNRDRSWRRSKARKYSLHENRNVEREVRPEKNWKNLYLRSVKLKRAAQLGQPYPRKTFDQILDEEMTGGQWKNEKINVLFVCSRNQWRSPTAEKIWSNHPGINARSAGTSPRARRTLTKEDIKWADAIIVMEKKHKNRIVASYQRLVKFKTIHVLDIPDQYKYMDPELISQLQVAVAETLGIE